MAALSGAGLLDPTDVTRMSHQAAEDPIQRARVSERHESTRREL
jgi:hypothetical protein